MKKVGIVNYEINNLRSVKHAVIKQGYDCLIINEPELISKVDILILPGVGAFKEAMINLRNKGLDQSIIEFTKSGKLILGICLGMQLLFNLSSEFGQTEGLGLVDGNVDRLESKTLPNELLKIPNTGWQKVYLNYNHNKHQNFIECLDKKFMYFIHSYQCIPKDTSIILTKTKFGTTDFCSSFMSDNIVGMQFHPEKSGKDGLGIYKILDSII